MNRDLRVLAIILSPNSSPFERLFWRPNIGSLEGHFWFLAQNTGNHVQVIANIVWIVIYALLRSFWEKTRRDLREVFEALKLAPWREILGFWPKTLEIIYKSWQILYESWSTRCRHYFEPKFDAIWENFFTAQNWLLAGQFWVFGPKRWKSWTNHGKCCKNCVQRVAAIILSPNSTRFERIFWRPKIGSFYGHFGFLAQNAGNHVQNIANIVWIVIYAYSRSFWAQTRLDLRDFFDSPKLAPWRAILGFWPKTLEIMYKSWQILYESWSTRSRDHFEPKLASIWETFLTAQNWLLGGPFWVFGPKRLKSGRKHC